MSPENHESIVLICQLLGCHTPQDQNEIIDGVLSIVANSRVNDHKEKLLMRNESAEALDRFERIASGGDSRLKAVYSELEQQQNLKASS